MIKELNKDVKKEKSKRIEGITLIALVITIIVLLILAGVSIATLGGDNGIIGRAKKASTTTREKQADEEATLVANEYEMYKKMCETDGNTPSVKEFLEKKYKGKYEEDNGKYKITTDSGNDIEIDDSGNITVNDNVVTGIKIIGNTIVNVGNSEKLQLMIGKDSVAYKQIEWINGDSNIATVEENGTTCTVTGNKVGIVVLECKITNYDGTIVSIKHNMNVINELKNELVDTNTGRGKYVQYNMGGVNSWRVFYIKDDYVYLITTAAVSTSWPGGEPMKNTNASASSWVDFLKTESNWIKYVDDRFALSCTGSPTMDELSYSLGTTVEAKKYTNFIFNNGIWPFASLCGTNNIWVMWGDTLAAHDFTYKGMCCRPVLKLKQGIKVKEGNGETGAPYILADE